MSDEQRLREHPTERFAGESHVFDLSAALQKLRAEPHEAQRGHRQQTIFHRAPVTQVLFAFDAGGELAEHSADGLVTIHVLQGALSVQAGGENHDLQAGQMIVLAPGVPHDVRAAEAAAMLLTVHLQKDERAA